MIKHENDKCIMDILTDFFCKNNCTFYNGNPETKYEINECRTVTILEISYQKWRIGN